MLGFSNLFIMSTNKDFSSLANYWLNIKKTINLIKCISIFLLPTLFNCSTFFALSSIMEVWALAKRLFSYESSLKAFHLYSTLSNILIYRLTDFDSLFCAV